MFAARITSPKKIEIEDIETPTIKEGQCLIKLERWSVCGSDIRHAYGPVMPEEEYPISKHYLLLLISKWVTIKLIS